MAQAFSDIRILDFTQVLSGPFAVMQMALLGAEVIKIEHPTLGDQTRDLASQDGDARVPLTFQGMNLNKRSLTLDLKSAKATAVIKKLVVDADVVVENFKAGTMARLGLDFETLQRAKPDLIYCSISGFGQAGPKAGVAAYDGAIQAASGMMSISGHPETGPTRAGYMPVDMSTALHAAFAISASLFRRASTGVGQYIDLAMMDTAVMLQASQFNSYLNGGKVPGLAGNLSPTKQPTASVFRTRDGFIQISAIRQAQVEKLFTVIGRTDDLVRPEFFTQDARIKNPVVMSVFLDSVLQHETTSHWVSRLEAAGVPAAEVRNFAEVQEDAQFDGRDVFTATDDPTGPLTFIKAGYLTNEDGPEVTTSAPELGEHTDEILRSIGYEAEEILELRDQGVI